jgi:TonB family protein
VAGRSVNGTLPRPSYGVQADGKVVVKIWVDQYGNVTKAQAGVEGTTATDKTLWQAAYKAALGAHFNMDATAPALQEGTITYIFRMR